MIFEKGMKGFREKIRKRAGYKKRDRERDKGREREKWQEKGRLQQRSTHQRFGKKYNSRYNNIRC